MVDQKILYQLSYLIKNGIEEKLVYSTAFDIIFSAISFDSASLFIKNRNSEELVNVYNIGEEIADLASEFDFGYGKGLAGWVIENSEPIIFSCFMNDNPERNFKSFVSIPLLIENNHIGVLNLGHKKSGYYTEKDSDGFNFLGCQLAILIDKISQKNEIDDKNKALKYAGKEMELMKIKLSEKLHLSNMGQNSLKLNMEINNPLSIISGYTELLLKKSHLGQVDQEELIKKLNMILESAKNINILTQSFKDINDKP